MIKFSNVSLRRGPRLLFDNFSAQIATGQCVGLTGANGTGKSSLFALLRDELHVDSGDIEFPKSWQIAHVAQETPGLEMSAIAYVVRGDEELTQLQQQIEQANESEQHDKLAALYAQMEAIDGYHAEVRAQKLLAGLGFSTADFSKPVSAFSGGWRMRLNLAQALMCRSQLMLLDEPTNHLDLETILWLESYLKQYQGTLIVISHDRDFLDSIVTHIAHIEQQGITLYTGNYSDFERQRAQALALQQACFEKQQKQVAHLENFIRRFKAKATKAKQAQSRVKALEKLELIAPAHVDMPFEFHFNGVEKIPNPVLGLKQVSLGYDHTAIINQVDFTLLPGTCLGLLGPNGAGKSTLIKLLAGDLTPLSGEYRPGNGLRVGYFAQHQLEQLHGDDTPLSHLQRLSPKTSEQSLRDFLGGFGFSNERAESPIAPFSGGEKARLVLASLVKQKPNLLLLDEPTNHLDLEMRHALTMALQEFEGAMILVSHDRHLLNTVCDDFMLVANGNVDHFSGDLDDYLDFLRQHTQEQLASQNAASKKDSSNLSAEEKKERRRMEAEKRKQLQPLKKKVASLEKQINKLEQQLGEIETRLSNAEIYDEANKQELTELLKQQGVMQGQLDEAETLWMEHSEELEALE